MRLEILGTQHVQSDAPTETDITKAVGDACSGAVDAVILDDSVAHGFMQTALGRRVECCITPSGPLYDADEVSPSQARELFLSFARGDDRWRSAVTWTSHAAGQAPTQRVHDSRAGKGAWDRDWQRVREEYRLRDLDEYKRTIRKSRQRLDDRSTITRFEWETLRWTGGIVRGPAALRESREQAIAETAREADALADEMETLYWMQMLSGIALEPMDGAFSKRKVCRELDEADEFLAHCKTPSENLKDRVLDTRESLAWSRARRKLSDADAALSTGLIPRSQRLRQEASTVLREDWPLLFPAVPVPALP